MSNPPFPPRKPGLLMPLGVRVGAISWMPKLLPQIVWTDKLLQRVTSGRVTILDIAGLPNMMLTTTGRKSGLKRSNPLLCVPDGERILIAGSYFGGPREPLWVKNLEANPEVTVRFRNETTALVSRQLVDEERAQAWPVMVRTWPNFARYEQRTHRQIKVFELVPPAAERQRVEPLHASA
ncbi:nitroreductase family deazaflavin-dependent oxidoreductase [Nocardioides marmorisolisilvae]|uniref:Nitroreductase family deazaflavin-dependent oxidoreductase n=1 Tax=Nocardioides marmorisolisilvae TaxID=1542737 RepID=A0A3N0DX42_9ACTN|nr:nitroreductase family deazaflavin-dependent oxidoreductase [Nocardioides marmorisolisilvae]RNL80165.1 nitroreductase family deazaflavin-dependent oxidoreductase [Nocardioides marmorisolisilvae]